MTSASPVPKLDALSPTFVFLQFIYLQGLDLLTTIAFLMSGVSEANPLVRFAIQKSGDPWVGLISVKLGAIALAMICLGRGRIRLLQRVNIFFALLVVWNLVCLVLGLVIRAR
jgi:hypothetical protein